MLHVENVARFIITSCMIRFFDMMAHFISLVIRITQGSSKVSHTCFKSSTSLRKKYQFRKNQFNTDVSKLLERYRLENCFLVARLCPRLRPMSSDPAVAAPAAQVPLRHAREVYRCTMFGTSQTWDIPDVLRGLRRNSGAFKAWYIAKVRLTRKSLAARGNIQACKSIKETKDRRRLYMKRRRDYQRVVAQQIALGENAAPWGALAASLEHEENLS